MPASPQPEGFSTWRPTSQQAGDFRLPQGRRAAGRVLTGGSGWHALSNAKGVGQIPATPFTLFRACHPFGRRSVGWHALSNAKGVGQIPATPFTLFRACHPFAYYQGQCVRDRIAFLASERTALALVDRQDTVIQLQNRQAAGAGVHGPDAAHV